LELSAPQIVLGIITAGLTALGAAKLLEMFYRRRMEITDRHDALHETNHGKAIDADITALNLITDRLTKVEARVDGLQEKLSEEMAKNSRLEAENEALKRENERQSKRLHGFAEQLVHKDKEILDLRNALHDTQIELEKLKTAFHASQNPTQSQVSKT
jgi:chromosome segregation ATPase